MNACAQNQTKQDKVAEIPLAQCRVQSEEQTQIPHFGLPFPIGAEVRIDLHMEKGQATFFVNGTELPTKAEGIRVPVHPCALSYMESHQGKQVEVMIARSGFDF